MRKIIITYTLSLEFDTESEMRSMNKVSIDAAKNSEFWLKEYIKNKAAYMFKQAVKSADNFTVTITEENK